MSYLPAPIREIQSAIGTAQGLLAYYDIPNERRLPQAAICGTVYINLKRALEKVQRRSPEATEIKRLLKIYTKQAKAMPICIDDDGMAHINYGDIPPGGYPPGYFILPPSANKVKFLEPPEHVREVLERYPSADFHEDNAKAMIKAARSPYARS